MSVTWTRLLLRLPIACLGAAIFMLLVERPHPALGEESSSVPPHLSRDKVRESHSQKRNVQSRSSDNHGRGSANHGERTHGHPFSTLRSQSLTQQLRVVLALDSSRSMRYTDPENLRNQGAKLFIRLLNPGDELALLRFDDSVEKVLPITPITHQSIAQFDAAIDAIGANGNFTDIEAGVTAAYEILSGAPPQKALNVVVLLSDGKMDARPSRGTKEALTEQLLNDRLPRYVWNGVRLFTIALGPEADVTLLEQMATATGGRSWVARDPDAVLRCFSELILAIRSVTGSATTPGGLLVREGTPEATFYIERKNGETQVILMSPDGKQLSVLDLPTNVRWFRGDDFDVITITKPHPGRWRVRTDEGATNASMLFSELEIGSVVPSGLHPINAELRLTARLLNGGEKVEVPRLKEITTFAYRVLKKGSNEVVTAGDLNDSGKDGDAVANDGEYSRVIHAIEEGEYDVVLLVVSPTFVREKRFSHAVGQPPVSLVVKGPDEEHRGVRFHVRVSRELREMKKLRVQVLIRPHGEAMPEKREEVSGKDVEVEPVRRSTQKPRVVKLSRNPEDEQLFEGEYDDLAPGEYELVAQAKVRSKNGKGRTVVGESDPLRYTHFPYEEGPMTRFLYHVLGAVFTLGALIVSVGIWRRYVGTFVVGKGIAQPLLPFQLDPDLTVLVAQLRERSSSQRRKPDDEERELFAIVNGGLRGELRMTSHLVNGVVENSDQRTTPPGAEVSPGADEESRHAAESALRDGLMRESEAPPLESTGEDAHGATGG